jgi:peptide-methionine (S)-S-oxide reductase
MRGRVMSGRTETAILAGGCFWVTQELVRHREGVVSTRAGYTGGENDNPTDENHPGHAEAVEVVFDPDRISYRELLEFFFQMHRPDLGADAVGSGYRSEIFYTSDEQRRVAEETLADARASDIWPGEIVTAISEARPFWEAPAEDQDYLDRHPHGHSFFKRVTTTRRGAGRS